MTCHECQRSLLQLLDPSVPSEELASHLAECAVCQQYQRRLVRIETNVPRLPVPASQALTALKRALLNPEQVKPEAQRDTTPIEVAASPVTIPMVVPGPVPLVPRRFAF